LAAFGAAGWGKWVEADARGPGGGRHEDCSLRVLLLLLLLLRPPGRASRPSGSTARAVTLLRVPLQHGLARARRGSHRAFAPMPGAVSQRFGVPLPQQVPPAVRVPRLPDQAALLKLGPTWPGRGRTARTLFVGVAPRAARPPPRCAVESAPLAASYVQLCCEEAVAHVVPVML